MRGVSMMHACHEPVSRARRWCPHLSLPEVVHEGQEHEDGIVGGAGSEGGDPDHGVGPAVRQGVDQGHQRQEDEVELPDDEGWQHQHALHRVVEVVPGHRVPVRVGVEHREIAVLYSTLQHTIHCKLQRTTDN